jgi:hypothetical protein
MREVVLADHVEAQVMDVTSLLISQAQHFGADMREHDSQLIQAQQMQESAKKSLREFEKNEKTDYKTVVEAGLAPNSCSLERWCLVAVPCPMFKFCFEYPALSSLAGTWYINEAKRFAQQNQREEEIADAAADYDSDDEKVQADEEQDTSGSGMEKGDGGGLEGNSATGQKKPVPRGKRARERKGEDAAD